MSPTELNLLAESLLAGISPNADQVIIDLDTVAGNLAQTNVIIEARQGGSVIASATRVGSAHEIEVWLRGFEARQLFF